MSEVKEPIWIEYHACFTGDCPHENVNDCLVSLREIAIESGKDYDKLKAENEKLHQDLEAAKELIGKLKGLLNLESDCHDNSCKFAKVKSGMRTNGGCRCFENNQLFFKMYAISAFKAFKLIEQWEKK